MKYEKIYEAFKKAYNADLLVNFQLCRAFLNDNCSITQLAEKIIIERYREITPKERGKIRECHGRSNAVIEIPRLELNATILEIFQMYVEKKFDTMVFEAITTKRSAYPQKFRDVIERNIQR